MARTTRSSLTASCPLGLVLTILLSSGLSFAQPTTAPTTMSFPVMPRPRTVQLITEPAIPNLDVSNALTGIETRLASGARLSVNRAEVRISGDGVRQEARLALGVQIFDVPDPA